MRVTRDKLHDDGFTVALSNIELVVLRRVLFNDYVMYKKLSEKLSENEVDSQRKADYQNKAIRSKTMYDEVMRCINQEGGGTL